MSGNKFSGVGVAAAVGSTTCKHRALIEEEFTVQRWDVLHVWYTVPRAFESVNRLYSFVALKVAFLMFVLPHSAYFT